MVDFLNIGKPLGMIFLSWTFGHYGDPSSTSPFVIGFARMPKSPIAVDAKDALEGEIPLMEHMSYLAKRGHFFQS